jgi:hypothetical protein
MLPFDSECVTLLGREAPGTKGAPSNVTSVALGVHKPLAPQRTSLKQKHLSKFVLFCNNYQASVSGDHSEIHG